LAAELARRPRDDVAKATERVGDRAAAKRQPPADDSLKGVQPEVQPRRNTEVAATAAEPPEQLGVLVNGGAHQTSVGRHELGADEVVAGEPVLRGQMSDSAAESQPADAGRPDYASGRNQAERVRRGVEVEPRGAAFRARNPCVGVDRDRAELGEVDHEPVVDHAVSCRVVPAPAHRDFESVSAREVERRGHVTRARAARDYGRPAVDERVEAASRRVVFAVVGSDHRPRERAPQLAQRPLRQHPLIL
jgi:hypothetical protein